MSIPFLAFSEMAAEQIVSDRVLQSTDFERGFKFVGDLMRGQGGDTLSVPGVSTFTSSRGGLYLLGIEEPTPNLVVVDLSKADILNAFDEARTLQVVQRLMRFALRYWRKRGLHGGEIRVADTSKVVMFPFPVSTKTGYRVMVDTSPDADRQGKRPGNHILVYRAGYDAGPGPQEVPSVTEFRAALEGLRDAKPTGPSKDQSEGATLRRPHDATALESGAGDLSYFAGFETWMRNLTAPQLSFVTSPLVSPHRIQGPAGTGKTMCLALKAVHTLRAAKEADASMRVGFFTHSQATRDHVQAIFDANDADGFSRGDPYSNARAIEITTLQLYCGRLLGDSLSDTEFLDRDASESKELQLLYVEEALSAARPEVERLREVLSPSLFQFLSAEDHALQAEIVQHEISLIIKGRAGESLDRYLVVDRQGTALPDLTEQDKRFLFTVYGDYRQALYDASQFDTDDVVLSALGRLDTPIWRRRRQREGYDAIFIDETHLFNFNELSAFHYFTKRDAVHPIAYSVDPSQSLQNRGWSGHDLHSALGIDTNEEVERTSAIFRCSPPVVDLAMSVTSAGATMFVSFDDAMAGSSSAFTGTSDQGDAILPIYLTFDSDDRMVEAAFDRADVLASELHVAKGEVAIIAIDKHVLASLERFARDRRKPVQVIKDRGDWQAVSEARKLEQYVLAGADYVGGLEFTAVILVGIDDGRVPAAEGHDAGSRAYLLYQALSRLYVAVTRARIRVEILAEKSRGPSQLLKSAFENGTLERADSAPT